MKKSIMITLLAMIGSFAIAQDTAYISRDKTTALFFDAAVDIIGQAPAGLQAQQKESGLITLKAAGKTFPPGKLSVQVINSGRTYHIPVRYSYGRAGREIRISTGSVSVSNTKAPENTYQSIAGQLRSGKRKEVVDHEKSGGVKAWLNKISLSGNRIFFRLDIRNKSNLPYDVDFIRFYIRDIKTVARMATHEQEIVPVYSTLGRKTVIVKKQELAQVFAFRRFSLSEDQALNVELYERNGNRHLYLRIRQKDLDDLNNIEPARQRSITLVANNIN